MMEMVKIGEVHFGKRWNNKMGGLGKVCFENLLPLLIHYIDPLLLLVMKMKILEIGRMRGSERVMLNGGRMREREKDSTAHSGT